MSSIEEGAYFIEKKDGPDTGLRLSLDIDAQEESYVLAFHPGEGAQEWELSKRSDDNYVIRNKEFDELYLAPKDSKLKLLDFLVAKTEPFEWRIQATERAHCFHIVAPGGPIEGASCEVVVDVSVLKPDTYPKKIALTPFQVYNLTEAWCLVKKDD